MNIDPNTSNHYSFLGVSRSATNDEIKKAFRKLAVNCHPDKRGSNDLMQRLNEAYKTLSDPQLRSNYDTERENSADDVPLESTEYLTCGIKLSDTFIEKIKVWKKTGPTDPTDRNYIPHDFFDQKATPHPGWAYCTTVAYKKLLTEHESSISNLIDQVVTIKKSLLGPHWSTPPSQIQVVPVADFKEQVNQADSLFSKFKDATHQKKYQLPDIEELKAAVQKHYSPQGNWVYSIKERHVPGTRVPLCPPHLKQLGFVPTHKVIDGAAVVQRTSSTCAGCKYNFGWYSITANCSLCGSSNCTSCSKYFIVADFVNPVSVCSSCSTTVLTRHHDEWLKPVEMGATVKVITPEYLMLLESLKIATTDHFMRWRDHFVEHERFDLAIVANHYAKMDWLQLAEIMSSRKQYVYAKRCFDFMTGVSSLDWEKKGDEFALADPFIALMCYYKAVKLDFLAKAYKYADSILGLCCFKIALLDCYNYVTAGPTAALKEKKYGLAALSFLYLRHSQEEWRAKIDEMSIEDAQVMVHYYNHLFQPDWDSFNLCPQKDHLSWQFIGEFNLDTWVGHLISLLNNDETGGKNSIPYFRSVMKGENFVEHRNRYLAVGQIDRAFVCHRLAGDDSSFSELAKKWKQNDRVDFAGRFMMVDNPLKLGDQFHKAGKFHFALCCYLDSGTVEEKKERLKQLCITKPELIRQVCIHYVENSIPQARYLVVFVLQHGRLSSAQELEYKKLLARSNLESDELLGLLDELKPLCDKDWFETTLNKAKELFKNDLRKVIYACDWNRIPFLLDGINQNTIPVFDQLLDEMNIDRMPPLPVKAICLALRAFVYYIKFDIHRCMNDYLDAMYVAPTDECIEYCVKEISGIQRKLKFITKLRDVELRRFALPGGNHFTGRLSDTPELKMIKRAEKTIATFKPFEAAMSYIDLSSAIPVAAGTVGGLLNAAVELVKELEQTTDDHERFAYRRSIFELVVFAFLISNRQLCSITQLHTARAGIAILHKAYSYSRMSDSENKVMQGLYQEIERLLNVVPLLTTQLPQVYDLIYMDVVNRKFLNLYLEECRNDPNQKDPKFQYYIFEGTWRGWIDQEKFQFEIERQKTMKALLEEKGSTYSDVEALMQWPQLPRNADGWLTKEVAPLKLVGASFSRVEGIRFNVQTGEVSLLLESDANPLCNLFDMDDVTEVLKLGITGAQFTLDPPSADLQNHPFQEMRYAPECLSRTNFLGTLLHADILLKMLSMGTEISGKAPFELRESDNHLLRRLPAELRQKFIALRTNMPLTAGRIHRFWIEAGELPFSQSTKGNECTIIFDQCEMSVEKHLMRRDHNGNLVDTEEDNDEDSPEAKFAQLMTEEYDNLGRYFPELARLRELTKLQALAKVVQSTYEASKILHNTFAKLGFADRCHLGSGSDNCTWVPAAFRHTDRYKVYGGVNMNPIMVSRPPGGGGNLPPRGGSVGPNSNAAGARHVVSMSADGRINATTTWVNQATQKTMRMVDFSTCVRDQWNQNSNRRPDVTGLMKSYTGQSETQRFTAHSNGAFHVHPLEGKVKCTNSQGNVQYYNKGEKHRCDQ